MALTTQQWVGLLKLLREEEPRDCGRGHPVEYPWWVIAGLSLWAAYQQWPNSRLAEFLQTEGWPKAFRRVVPRKMRRHRPDESTLSRRFRSEKLERLLSRVLMRLAKPSPFGIADGFVLGVGRHSEDPDARFGGASSHFRKGYKAVRFVNVHGQSWATTVASANHHEIPLATEVIEALAIAGLRLKRALADSLYDAETFRRVAFEKLGALLVAPSYPRGIPGTKRSRLTRKGPLRQRSQKLLRSAWGRHWWKQRGIVERSNGWLRQAPHNLGWLPPFVRTLVRVRRWLLSHEVLLSYRKTLRLAGSAA